MDINEAITSIKSYYNGSTNGTLCVNDGIKRVILELRGGYVLFVTLRCFTHELTFELVDSQSTTNSYIKSTVLKDMTENEVNLVIKMFDSFDKF